MRRCNAVENIHIHKVYTNNMLNVAGEKCVKNVKYLYYLSIGIKKMLSLRFIPESVFYTQSVVRSP